MARYLVKQKDNFTFVSLSSDVHTESKQVYRKISAPAPVASLCLYSCKVTVNLSFCLSITP